MYTESTNINKFLSRNKNKSLPFNTLLSNKTNKTNKTNKKENESIKKEKEVDFVFPIALLEKGSQLDTKKVDLKHNSRVEGLRCSSAVGYNSEIRMSHYALNPSVKT